MNGELDIIPQRSLRRILSGSNVCHSNHLNLKHHISSLDTSNFSNRTDLADFEGSSSGVLSAGSDGICDDSVDCGHGVLEPTVPNPLAEAILNRNNSSNTSDVSANFCAEETTTSTQPLVTDFDNSRLAQPSSKLQRFLNTTLTDEKFFNSPSMFEDLKSSIMSEDSSFFPGGQLFNQCKQLSNTEISHLLDNGLPSAPMSMDPHSVNLSANSCKPKAKIPPSFSIGEPECDESCSSVTSWGRYPLLPTEETPTLNTANDSPPQLLGTIAEPSVVSIDNVMASQYSLTPMSAAAAKRAITGGHQTAKSGIPTRPSTWSSSASSGYQLPSNTGGWSCASKASVPITAPNQGAPGVTHSSPSPTSWSASQQALKANNLSNFMSNLSLEGSGTNVPGPARSVSANVSPFSSGRASSGLTNIYSMFPKRPQHRMMAHWQQQQQHHSGTSHSQSLKNPLAFQNSTVSHVTGNRVTANGASGDGTVLNFNNGSVLQAISSIAAATNSSICSSGDSLGTVPSIVSSAVDTSTPLDTFKFGLDQQLMEAIKAFGPTNISPNNSSNLEVGTANEAALILGNMDETVNSFGEVDPQLSNLSTMNPLSLLNQNSCSNNISGLAGLGCTNNHAPSMRNLSGLPVLGSVGLSNSYPVFANVPPREEGYSRKVFVGGLPPDIDEEEITTAFRRFGPLIVDWPHKTESKAYFPPKGYCFLLFQDERSVQSLINACIVDEGKYYWCVSSPTMKDKPVQIRPWNLADSDFVMDGSQPLDPRKTIFVGGVPRPLRAIELALIMDRLYSGVCYAGIDTDPELKYPKGAGRVAFSNQQSYIAAISARFVQLQHNEIDKRVEVKPYVLDNQLCDECQGARCGGKFAPFFCANVACLQYYCEQCWVQIHSRNGREYHKPLVKEGAERPRPALYRW